MPIRSLNALCSVLFTMVIPKLFLKTFISMWQECLLGLLSSKTVIYVTHQVEFLPAADLILVSHSHFSFFSDFHSWAKIMAACKLCL